MQKRENGLDLMRIIAALFVVAVHVCTVQRKIVTSSEVLDFNYHFFSFMRHWAQSAVTVFIMVSGAFVIKGKSTRNYRAFYKKSWGKLVVPTIVFTIFYLFFEWLVYYRVGVYGSFLEEGVALKSFILQVVLTLQGLPAEHMWYMYALIGLYILGPMLAYANDNMTDKDFTILAVVMCVWGVIDALTQPPILNWGIGYVSRLLGIFMMGYVVHEWALKKSGNGLAIGLICAGVLVNVIEYIIHLLLLNNETFDEIIAPQRPYNALIVVTAMLYIAGFTILDIDTKLTYPSALTYWVYLVHPAVMMIVFMIESVVLRIPYLELGTTNMIMSGVANTVIVYLLSFAVGHLIEKYVFGRKNKAKAQ